MLLWPPPPGDMFIIDSLFITGDISFRSMKVSQIGLLAPVEYFGVADKWSTLLYKNTDLMIKTANGAKFE